MSQAKLQFGITNNSITHRPRSRRFSPLIRRLGQFDIHRESLLLEISNGKFVGVRQKMEDRVFHVIILEMIHQVRSVTFHLRVIKETPTYEQLQSPEISVSMSSPLAKIPHKIAKIPHKINNG